MLRVNWITSLQVHMFSLVERHFFFLTLCGKYKQGFQINNAKFKAKLFLFLSENKIKHAESIGND